MTYNNMNIFDKVRPSSRYKNLLDQIQSNIMRLDPHGGIDRLNSLTTPDYRRRHISVHPQEDLIIVGRTMT